jgi:hypothetical protein
MITDWRCIPLLMDLIIGRISTFTVRNKALMKPASPESTN